MNWIQIKARIDPEIAEAMEESLVAAGAMAITFEDAADQPVFEPERGTTPLWTNTILTALFSANEDMEKAKIVAEKVFAGLSSAHFPNCKIEILENEDWTRKWIENFKPIQFGKRLWICPSWCKPPEQNAVNLMLDPGLAFGTGTHPTTSLCLKWLDQADLNNKNIIDFGCGSGVLGIAALLLGAKNVVAVDNDPQALQASIENAQRNQLNKSKLLTFLPEDLPPQQADIVLANILAQPLHELKEHLSSLTTPGGTLVMSGILESQAQTLSSHYSDHFEMEAPEVEGEWVRLVGHKNQGGSDH